MLFVYMLYTFCTNMCPHVFKNKRISYESARMQKNLRKYATGNLKTIRSLLIDFPTMTELNTGSVACAMAYSVFFKHLLKSEKKCLVKGS